MITRAAIRSILASLSILGSAMAADDIIDQGLREFEKANEASSVAGFQQAAATFQRAADQDPQSITAWYWLATARFHEVLTLPYESAPPKPETIDQSRRQAIDALEHTLRLAPTHAEAHAMLATLLGMRIEASPLRGITLGTDLKRHRKLASDHGANNPRAQYLVGAILLHTANNDQERRRALEFLQHAENLYQKEAKQPTSRSDPRWGRAGCLAFMGMAWAQLNDNRQAADHFRKSLAIQSNQPLAKAGLAELSSTPQHP